MLIRELAWPDIPELVALERELFAGDAWGEASWWSELAGRPRRWYVVAADETGIAGYAGLDLGGDVADVMTIAVAGRAQGTGLGRRLLELLLDRSAADGAQAVLLEVRADNAPARALYDRFGFETIQTRRKYYQPGDVDALVMRRLLDPAPATGSRTSANSAQSTAERTPA